MCVCVVYGCEQACVFMAGVGGVYRWWRLIDWSIDRYMDAQWMQAYMQVADSAILNMLKTYQCQI